ncbi:LPS biosynthesis protein [Vibrio caribbeanicus]|uniref:Putative flippase, involved in lipopolysaccharide biosynthesis n=1 Tax=Vibrio caribbeanicus ATCC BAA-2122 TaxID=796620 RepID=E3BJ59_9VIBR|nr:LPS biosynthesis protein [Vibrio caribbeanicus]EFP96985.1 putative flippase, involved in lipopolysaccharide biosynthesis [Vibrio caribbeanicus ATCC BAA-2122]
MNFASTTLFTVAQTVMKMLAGFVVIKIVASLSGPEGMSNLGVVQNVNLIYVMLCGGIMATGITKNIASNDRNKSLFGIFNSVKSLESKLSIIASIIVVIVIVLLYFLSSHDYQNLMLLIIISLVLTFFHAKVLIYISALNGLFKIRELSGLHILASVFTIIISTVTYYLYPDWRLAVVSLPLGYAIVFFIIRKERNRLYRYYNRIEINKSAKESIQQYAIFGVISAICLPTSQLIIRTYIANDISVHDSGIWQGVIRFSEVYLVLISSALSVYLIPKISNMKDGKCIKRLVYHFVGIVSLVSIAGMFAIYSMREYIIVILFDDTFEEMASLFLYQLPGDFFKIISWVFAFSMLGLGSVKKMLILEVIFSLTYVVLSILGVNVLGVKGAVVAYSINYVLYFFAIGIIFGVEVGKHKKKST